MKFITKVILVFLSLIGFFSSLYGRDKDLSDEVLQIKTIPGKTNIAAPLTISITRPDDVQE